MPAPWSLQVLRGCVAGALAFQRLCPGCVAHALPLAARVDRRLRREQVAMIGLHTVCEAHDAMTPTALAAWRHDYRIGFPVGVGRAGGIDPIPATVRASSMRGTLTWRRFDPRGRVQARGFGDVDALRLGSAVGALRERVQAQRRDAGDTTRDAAAAPAGCDAGACRPGDDRG